MGDNPTISGSFFLVLYPLVVGNVSTGIHAQCQKSKTEKKTDFAVYISRQPSVHLVEKVQNMVFVSLRLNITAYI